MPNINLDITINIGTDGLIEIQKLTFDSSSIKQEELKKQISNRIITLYHEGFNFENQDIRCFLKPSDTQPLNKVKPVHHTILAKVINDETVLELVQTAIAELVQTAIAIESQSNKKLSSSTEPHHDRVAPPPQVDTPAVKPRPYPLAPPKAENTTGNKGSMQEALKARMFVQRKGVDGDGPRNSYDTKNYSERIACNLTLIKVGERDPSALDISGNNKLYIYKNTHGHIQFRFEHKDNLKPAVEKLLEKPACLDDCDDDSDNDSDWSDGEEVKSSEKTSEYNPGELASLQLNDKNAYLELSDVLALTRALDENSSATSSFDLNKKTLASVLQRVSACIDSYVEVQPKKMNGSSHLHQSSNDGTGRHQGLALKIPTAVYDETPEARFERLKAEKMLRDAGSTATVEPTTEMKPSSSNGTSTNAPQKKQPVALNIPKAVYGETPEARFERLKAEKMLRDATQPIPLSDDERIAGKKILNRLKENHALALQKKWRELAKLLTNVLKTSSNKQSVVINLMDDYSFPIRDVNHDVDEDDINALIPLVNWFSRQGIDLSNEMQLPFLRRKREKNAFLAQCSPTEPTPVPTILGSINRCSSGEMNPSGTMVYIDTPNKVYSEADIRELFNILHALQMNISNVHMRAEAASVGVFERVRAEFLAMQPPRPANDDSESGDEEDQDHNQETAAAPQGFSFAMILSFMADNPVKTIAGVLVIVAGVAASLMSLGVIPAGVAFAGCVAMVASALSVTSAAATGIVGGVALSAAVLTAGAGLYCSMYHQPSNNGAGAAAEADEQQPRPHHQ